MPLRFLTAGESHGPALTAILEGMPAGVKLSAAHLNQHLRRRQLGYGRGRRMQIESDEVEILSGVRHGRTLGGPVALMIRNNTGPAGSGPWPWKRLKIPRKSASRGRKGLAAGPVTRPRPGHADWPGALKYNFTDVRECTGNGPAPGRRPCGWRWARRPRRCSGEFGIRIGSHVVRLGPVAAPSDKDVPPPAPETLDRADQSPVRCLDPEASAAMVGAVDEAKAKGETLGGVFEVVAWGGRRAWAATCSGTASWTPGWPRPS